MKSIEIYVAPNGNDSNDGSKKFPFATLEAAKRAAGRYRRDGKQIYINIKGGCYYLDHSINFSAADGGMPGLPITYRGYGRTKPTFIGGMEIPREKISKLTDEAMLARVIDKSKRNKIYKIDLSDFKDYLVADSGATGDKSYSPFELYENDTAMIQARFPKKDNIAGSYGHYASFIKCEYKKLGEGFKKKFYFDELTKERASLWDTKNTDMGIAGMFSHAWCHENLHIYNINMKKGYVETVNRMIYDVGNPVKKSARVYYYNIFEELSQPGEYFIDRKNNAAYVIPRQSIEKTTFVIPTLDSPAFDFGEQVRNIKFENIAVKYTRGTAISLSSAFDIEFSGCDIAHGGRSGFSIRKCENTVIDNCRIYDFGRSGIRTCDIGDGYRPGKKQITITNCDIFDCSRVVHCYNGSIGMENTHGVILRGCKLHGSAHAVFSFLRSSDMIIENNEFFDGVKDTDDAALIYWNGGVSTIGIIIKNNYFHDWGTPYASWGVNAIYADGGTGADIYNNIFVGNEVSADKPDFTVIKAHAESATCIHNNVFLTSQRYYSLGTWDRKENFGICAWIPFLYGCKTSTSFVGGFEYDEAIKSGYLGKYWKDYYKGTVWEKFFEVAKPSDIFKIYNYKEELSKTEPDEQIIMAKATLLAHELTWNHKLPDGSIYEGSFWNCIKTKFKDIYDEAIAETEGKSELEKLKRLETLALEMFWFKHLIPVNLVRAYDNVCVGIRNEYIEENGKVNLGYYSAETELVLKPEELVGGSVFLDEENAEYSFNKAAFEYIKQTLPNFENKIGIIK